MCELFGLNSEKPVSSLESVYLRNRLTEDIVVDKMIAHGLGHITELFSKAVSWLTMSPDKRDRLTAIGFFITWWTG